MHKVQKPPINKKKYLINLLTFVIMTVLIMVVVIALNATIKNNVTARVKDETKFLAEQQAEVINNTIENQFHKISTIASMVENGLSFSDAKDQKILGAYVKKNELCMLAYADKNGDVITYNGEKIGNITDRKYFNQIMDGRQNL